MNNKGAEQPLYLSYVCENLRQFGDYSLVTKRLQSYPPNIDELQNLLLDEAFTIIDNQLLVDAVSENSYSKKEIADCIRRCSSSNY